MAETPYSSISEVHITNFMSIRSAVVSFDEEGIVKILGYNDIGKSAVLRALGVALLNKWPSKQKSFIKDDMRFFQVDVVFDDNVTVRYEKHDSGSSLYEMYQDDELMFTTKLGNNLYEKITGVPEKVSEYLGLISTPDGTDLNYGINSDKQLLVETTGSENYKTINTVLKSEEIYRAVNQLNKDNNALQGDINQVETEVYSNISQLDSLRGLDDRLVEYATKFNDEVTFNEKIVTAVEEVVNLSDVVLELPKIPSVEGSYIDFTVESELANIFEMADSASKISIPPEVEYVNDLGIGDMEFALSTIKDYLEYKDSQVVSVDLIETDEIAELFNVIGGPIKDAYDAEQTVKEKTKELKEVKKENSDIIEELKSQGEAVTECPNCGELHIAEVA